VFRHQEKSFLFVVSDFPDGAVQGTYDFQPLSIDVSGRILRASCISVA
jgi:hypothetical protein